MASSCYLIIKGTSDKYHQFIKYYDVYPSDIVPVLLDIICVNNYDIDIILRYLIRLTDVEIPAQFNYVEKWTKNEVDSNRGCEHFYIIEETAGGIKLSAPSEQFIIEITVKIKLK